MITDHIKQNLENTLRFFLEEPKGREYLISLDETKIRQISDKLTTKNSFGDLELLDTAIYGIWGSHSIQEFISHSLWCAHREAIWRSTVLNEEKPNLDFHVNGIEHLLHTMNQPTIVISPMSLCTEDAMEAIQLTIQSHQPERRFICYGENMESYLDRNQSHHSLFADDTVTGIRKILDVLASGGIFFTYPDFVYKKHNSVNGKLFGIPRAFSAGLLKIAVRSQALLLPVITKHQLNTIEVIFFESLSQNKEENINQNRQLQEQILILVIGKLLEALILQIPYQWRLLPTLSHESLEMA